MSNAGGSGNGSSPTPPPVICLAMIVRDEAPSIRQCLDSIRPVISQWVVIDTGSKDGTPNLAREALAGVPGEVLHRPWRDFATNRNEAIAAAACHGDYVLILDADMVLQVESSWDPAAVARCAAAGYLGAYRDPDRRRESWRALLIRSSCAARFHGAVFDRLVLPGDAEVKRLAGLSVTDHSLAEADRRRISRNLQFALRARSAVPNDSPRTLHIARCFQAFGDFTSACAWYAERLAQPAAAGKTDREERWSALYYGALCRQARGEPWGNVEADLANAFDLDPTRAEPLYHLARQYREAGELERAAELAELGAGIKLPRRFQPVERHIYDYRLPLEHAIHCRRGERFEDSIAACNRGLNCDRVPEAEKTQLLEIRSASLARVRPIYPLQIHHRNRIVVIAAFHNAGSFLKQCIDSLREQDYDDFIVVLIDDASTDGALDGCGVDNPRFHIVRNTERCGSVANHVQALTAFCNDDDIVVFLDADDWLADAGVLSYINDFYDRTGCWVMYGQYRNSKGGIGQARPLLVDEDLDVIGKHGFRFPVHPRTHRVGLFARLRERDPELRVLRDEGGAFLDGISDLAMLRPICQLAGPEHVRYNDRVLYIYNVENPLSIFRDAEHRRRQLKQCGVAIGKPVFEPVAHYRRDCRPLRRKTRLLWIGLDAANLDLLERFAAQGDLPVLGGLLARCGSHRIRIDACLGTASFWTSASTGVNPGRHGRILPADWNIDEQRYQFDWLDRALPVRTVWDALSNAGRRVALIDIPLLPLSQSVNGMQIANWLIHSDPNPLRTVPADLAADLTERFGVDPCQGWSERGQAVAEVEVTELTGKLVQRINQKTTAALHYLDRGDWDVFALAFQELHDAGHRLWCVHDERHPEHNPAWRARHGDPIKTLYVELDRAVRRLLDAAGPDAQVMLVGGLGMRAQGMHSSITRDICAALDRHYRGPDPLPSLGSNARWLIPMPYSNSAGAIRFNLAGREPHGVLQPGSALDALCTRLMQDLRAIVDADSGRPVVDAVVNPRDSLHGSELDRLPDLFIVWRHGPCPRALRLAHGETIEVKRLSDFDFRNGDHHNAGFVMADFLASENVAAECVAEAIAPTLAAYFDTPFAAADAAPLTLITTEA